MEGNIIARPTIRTGILQVGIEAYINVKGATSLKLTYKNKKGNLLVESYITLNTWQNHFLLLVHAHELLT